MNQQPASWALTAALLFYAGSAYAQDVVAVPAGNDTIIPMKKGEPAPVDGQLFDNATSIRWANWLMQYKQKAINDKSLDQTICQAHVDLQQAKLDALQKQYDTVTKDLQEKLNKAQEAQVNPPFYHTATFGIVVGVVGTVALGAAMAAVVNAVK